MVRRLRISRPMTAWLSDDFHVFDLNTKEPVVSHVQIRRQHMLSFAYDVSNNGSRIIRTLSPKNVFMDNWEIKNMHSGRSAVISRQIPAEWFTEYHMTVAGQMVCIFRQSNTVSATEFVAEFAEELQGWSEDLLVSVPLVMMASNPFICSFRSEAQGGT